MSAISSLHPSASASNLRRRYVVIVNPATRGNAEVLLSAVRAAAPAWASLDIHFTTGEPIATDLFGSEEDLAAIVAIGGDGTVADVAQVIGDFDVPLGIVPGGSTNIIARNLRIPASPAESARALFQDNRELRIDVGLCNGRRFLHMAGAGFDSRLFMATNRRLKRHFGWLAYLPGAAQSVMLPPADFTLRVDHVTVDIVSPMILVANGAAVIHPAFPIYPGIRSDDGWLDIVAFSATRLDQMVESLARLATRSLDRSPYAFHLRGRSVSMTSDPPMPLQIDGDVIGETPATFAIAERALRILVPR